MKQGLSTILLLFFTTLLFSQKYYCYTPDGRTDLDVSAEYLTIQPTANVSAKDIRKVFNRSKLFHTLLADVQLVDFKGDIFLKFPENISNTKGQRLIEYLQSLSDVEAVYPFFQTSVGQLMTYDRTLFVGLKSEQDLPLLEQQAKQLGFRINKMGKYDPLQFKLEVFPQKDALAVANHLAESGNFEYAEVDFIQFFNLLGNANEPSKIENETNALITTDPLYPMQWHLENTGTYPSGSNIFSTADADIDASAAWAITNGNGNIGIAVVDDGVNSSAPDLTPNLEPGYDATGGGITSTMTSATGHGTEVAETAAAAGYNNIGGVGVAYNCHIIPVKIFEFIPGFGGGTVTRSSWIADGIDWAWKEGGADVINNSYGTNQSSALVTAAIQRATTSGRSGMGSLCFFSTGNENNSYISYPADLSEVVAVGATNSCDYRRAPTSAPSCDGDVSWGSNYGTGLDVTAPGNLIENASGNSSGTSLACPIVAGIGALILSKNPSLTATQVRYYIESTCDKVGGSLYTYYSGVTDQPNGTWNDEVGYGRVNAASALAAVPAPPAKDVTVVSVTPPQSDCGLGNTALVDFNLMNLGSTPATNILVQYRIKLNNGAFGNWIDGLTYVASLPFLTDYSAGFSIPISGVGEYTIEVRCQYPGDTNSQNDVYSATFSNYRSVSTFPYNEDFETDDGGWHASRTNNPFVYGIPYVGNNYINTVGSGTYCWWTNDPGTANTGYFPFQSTAYLYSPCLDFSGMTNDPRISFKLIYQLDPSSNSDHLTLESSTDGGTTWNTIGAQGSGTNWYGAAQGWTKTSSAAPGQWVDVQQSLSGLAGEANVRLRFNFVSDLATEGEGVGFDKVNIEEPPSNDALVSNILTPVSDCDLGAMEQVDVIIENKGANTITTCPVYYRYNFNNSGFTTWTLAGNYNGSINSASSALYSFTVDFSAEGSYQLEVKTQLSGDANTANDVKSTSFTHYAPIVNYPYNESFELSDGYWMVGGSSPSWQLGAPSGINILSAADGAKAWETNLQGIPNEDEYSYVRSPCFDFSGLTSPQINLDVWWDNETDSDGARLEYSTNGGNTWVAVGAYGDPDNWYNSQNNAAFGGSEAAWSGFDIYGGLSNWVLAKHGLSNLAGQSNVLFRIVFAQDPVQSVSTNLDGFAFDNITIGESNSSDAGVSEILKPTYYGCSLGANDTVKVTLKNYGDTTLTTIPVEYRIDYLGAGFSPWTSAASYNGSLISGAKADYSFLANFSGYGEYQLEVRTALSGDGNVSNDVASKTITNLSTNISSFPWCTDFENGIGEWSYGGGQANSWEVGVPAGVFINTAAGGSQVAMTGLNSDYFVNEFSYLLSPCLDLSAMNFGVISFDLWYETEADKDGLRLEYSINGGETWVSENMQAAPYNSIGITAFSGDDGWSGSTGGWVRAQAYLSPIGSSDAVLYRFVFASDGATAGDGVAIDNICIFDADVNPLSSLLGCNSFNLLEVKGYNEYYINDNFGNTVGTVTPNGNDLGDVTLSYNKMATVPQADGGVFYLPRYFNIECSGGADCPSSGVFPQGDVSVNLYFDAQELADYNTAGTTMYTPADLYATHFDGVNENCDLNDNGMGLYSLINKSDIFSSTYNGGSGFSLSMNLTSFSEIGLHGTPSVLGPNSALPLSLESFDGRLIPEKNQVLLIWETSNEADMALFEVEHSTDLLHFEKIGHLVAKNKIDNHYQTIDFDPNKGQNYYRLKMVNRDGSFSYSSTVSVSLGHSLSGIRIWPLPTKDLLYFEINSNYPESIQLKIMGLDGRLLKQMVWQVGIGKSVLDVDISDLPTGVYFLEAQREDGASDFMKLIKS